MALALILSTENMKTTHCLVSTSQLKDASAPLKQETLKEFLLMWIIFVYIYHIWKLEISETFLTCLKIAAISSSAEINFMKTNKNRCHFLKQGGCEAAPPFLLSCKCLLMSVLYLL